MASLYEIDSLIKTFIDDNMDPDTGEIMNLDALATLEMMREEKIENIALYYKDTVAMAKAVKEEKQALAERQAKLEKKAESLQKLLDWSCGGSRFETSKVSVSYRKSTTVVIDDLEGIPISYTRVKTEVIPDKVLIKEAFKEGKTVSGCHIETKQNIQVK